MKPDEDNMKVLLERELILDKQDGGVKLFLIIGGFVLFVSDFSIWGFGVAAILLVLAYGAYSMRKRFRLTMTRLYVDKVFLGYKRTTYYVIEKMSHLSVSQNVKSDMYTSSGSLKILGIDRTPESWKTYYYYPEILSFTYDGVRVELGKGYREFGAEEMKDAILKLQSIASKVSDIQNSGKDVEHESN